MLDFASMRRQESTLDALCADLTVGDLQQLTNEMIDAMLALIADCGDADVVFEPDDPEAEDTYAENVEEVFMPWTLGHVIVHVTASAEEAAFLAAELARGVPHRRRRSRYEVPWRSVTTVAQCRARLEESRRMRLASLDLWPDPPHLDNLFPYGEPSSQHSAIVRFVLGLKHDDDHLGQIADIVRQARPAGTPDSAPDR